MDKLYNTAQLAQKLDVAITTLHTWRRTGQIIPLYTVGELITGKRRTYLYSLNTIKKSKVWKEYQYWVKSHYKNEKLSPLHKLSV